MGRSFLWAKLLSSVFEDVINRYFDHLICSILKVILSNKMSCIREKTFVVIDVEAIDITGNATVRVLFDFKNHSDLGFFFGILFADGLNLFAHNFRASEVLLLLCSTP